MRKQNKQYSVNDADDIIVVMPMYNLIVYSDNDSNMSGI